MVKACSKCGLLLPLSEFSPDKRTALGVGSQCKRCNRERMREYGKKRKAERAAYNNAYRQANREKLLASNKAWRKANAEVIKAARRAKYPTIRDQAIAYQISYRETHREYINARGRRWYRNNVAHVREYGRYWRKKNPDKFMAHIKQRRALKCGAREGGLTAEQWRRIKEAYGHRCVYCCKPFQRLTQDHVIPLSKGGSHTKDNVVPACTRCNCKKWAHAWTPKLVPKKGVIP
jgi:5-methylcytosine-specific restriction endonuclease McrA